MTVREIAKASGLSTVTVVNVSTRGSWSGLPIDTIEKFSRGCGVDLLRPAPHIWFWRREKKVYLQNCTRVQQQTLIRLMRDLVESNGKN